MIQILALADAHRFKSAAPGLFDCDIDAALTQEFLADPRHHIAVALDGDQLVAFVSAVHYIHPDKQPELWINEVAVAPAYQSRGIGRKTLAAMLDHGKSLGCREAWVLTDRTNISAMRLYAGAPGARQPTDQLMYSFKL